MKLAALIIVAFTSTSYAGDSPSTRPAVQEIVPADLFRLSLQPAFPVPDFQPPLPFTGHYERVNIGHIGPGPLEDATFLPLAPMRPQATLLPPALTRPQCDLIDDRR
jgi:hypothetical protein